jgi:3-phenylpropionate/trans-cinnamate dioxygenase ferredoxin subunit
MSEWIPVIKADDLSDGAMNMVNAGGQELLIAQVGNTYYAADNRCAHMGGILSQGKLSGTIVTCPLHGSQFDLKDGHVVRWTNWSGFVVALAKVVKSPHSIKTYSVKSHGGQIMVEI